VTAQTASEWQQQPVEGPLHAVSHAYAAKIDGFTVRTMGKRHNLQ